MNKVFLFITILLFGTQNNKNHNTDPDYYNYYLGIYAAEKSICYKDYPGALDYYKKTFSQYEKKFYYDLYNAALCAEKTKEYYALDSILKDLNSLGYNAGFLAKSTLQSIDSINNWNYTAIQDSLIKTFETNIDSNLWAECYFRAEEDTRLNLIRIREGSVEATKNFDELIYDNIKWLVSIIDSCGYPDRKMVGDDALGILITHYFQEKAPKSYEPLKKFDFYKYPEDSVINDIDRIPLLEIMGREAKKGNMLFLHYINLHNNVRTILEGKFFYKKYYNSDKWPAVFTEEKDSVLMKQSLELYELIEGLKMQGETEFKLGRSIYKLETMEDYKNMFNSK